MTFVLRVLTLAVVAGMALPMKAHLAVHPHPQPAFAMAPASAPGEPVATRKLSLRFDGQRSQEWASIEAARLAEVEAQAQAEQAAQQAAAEAAAAAAQATWVAAQPAPRVVLPAQSYSGSVPDLVRSIFAANGQAAVDWALRVAMCESGFSPNSYNGGSGASGVFQFLPSTWSHSPYASSSPFNAEANVRAAQWLYSRSGPNQWSCT